MDFINKLIKKGIFSLALCFTFFAFLSGESVSAESTCNIKINDGNEYLVLNTNLDWSDSGVSIYCDSVKMENVSVSINGGTPIQTTDSGRDVSKTYLVNAGFYKIKYYLTSDNSVSITRQVRVLPENLNGTRSFWTSTFTANTAADDMFVKSVLYGDKGYLAIGNFGTSAYVASFDLLGRYKWHNSFANTKLYDIVNSGLGAGDIYFVVGQNENGKGVIKSIQPNVEDTALGAELVNIELADIAVANKLIVSGNYVYVAGYLANNNNTKTGKLVRMLVAGNTLTNTIYYPETASGLDTEFKSLIAVQDNGVKIIGVGSTSVVGADGAVGGMITVCNDSLSTCEQKNAYIWQNSNGASTTTTTFNDIIKQGNNYLIVGKSRVDKVNGSSASNNAGTEDSLVVLMDSTFNIIDVALRGSASYDELYSIKEVSTNNYIAVGKMASVGSYLNINVSDNKLLITENTIAGKTGNIELKDVLVKKDANEEINYIFVGGTQSSIIEDMLIGTNAGAMDAAFLILDATKYADFDVINVLQNASICKDGSTNCSANQLLDSYKMKYGAKTIVVSAANDISSEVIATYDIYHSFDNEQGVKFIIGRDIIVSANPVAPDITSESMGIDKWYLYSRVQNVGSNVSQRERQPLWTTRYIPVENNLTKDSGVTYYVISGGDFVVDSGTRDYTYNNYVKLADEPLKSTAALQSIEKAKEYALLQEFARVAFVQTKYNYDVTGINAFQGEIANLSTQNYYFVYYIDLNITTATGCGTNNGVLYGSCSEYTGYAFASLFRIKEIASLILENKKFNSFVSESNNRYNPAGNISIPETPSFEEEMFTEKHIQNTSIGLTQNLHLEVVHYSVFKNADNKYEYSTIGTTTSVTGKNSVVFSGEQTADYKEEGKYVVRYCYNYGKANQNCGEPTTFIIDRTAPIVNYNLTNGNSGSINKSSLATNPILVTTSMNVKSIIDADPYAYTVVNGVKYYLQCNVDVNSAKCIDDLATYVNKKYEYQKDNPNQLFNIVVYDRAGNYINTYFKVGTEMPKVSISDKNANNESFILTVEFFNRNDIDSFKVEYTKSENCTACANGADIAGYILDYINALIQQNYAELEKVKKDPIYEPIIVSSYNFTFSMSIVNADGSISGGLSIPKVAKEEVDGKMVYTLVENEHTLLPVSRGLYKFTMGDPFHNVSEAFGGIGLEKAELYVYVNEDDNAEERIEDLTSKIPMTREELGDSVPDNVLVVKDPKGYAYADQIPADLLNDFNSSMAFTNKFMYVKFKKSEFGIIRISKANKLNTAGGFGPSEASNTKLTCMFKIYGSQVAAADAGECDPTTDRDKIPLESISSYNDDFNAKGIYFVAENNGYYYMAFTESGTYDIWSEVYVAIDQVAGGGNAWTAIPVFYSFTIDRIDPVIEFSMDCSGTCIGEKTTFEKSDFVGNASIINIGNNNMKFAINKDFVLDGSASPSVNRLLVMSINGEIFNAYSYSLTYSDKVNGDYIIFNESGIYEIEFIDAALNSEKYRFIIDKTAPQVDKIEDINGKNFNTYQQYVEVEVVVSETSFLANNLDKNMIVFQYWVDSGAKQEITVKNEAGNCVVSTGIYDTGNCIVEDAGTTKSIKLSLVIPVNRDEASRNPSFVVQTLNIKVVDYFGNERVITQSFVFDNLNPYLYFTKDYTPILEFGENVSNDERQKMLSTSANSLLGHFNCDAGMSFTVGTDEILKQIIMCGDTPEMEGISNNLTIDAYEAQRVSFNNYKKNIDGTYSLLPNGTYLSVTDTVYKKRFNSFTSSLSLEASIGKIDIYSKGAFIKVTNKEYIDPNLTYFDENGNNGVTIQDMYTRSDNFYTTCEATNRKCMLYKMYIEDGTFAQDQNYYVYDTNEYMKIENTDTIITSDYLSYYYTTETYQTNGGKYLPAKTLKNTCIKVNSEKCAPVEANRVKLKSFDSNTFIYYNIVSAKAGETITTNITMADNSVVKAVVDNRIWNIALDTNSEQVKFGFGLASNLGRPIIFVAKDGAGNISSNYLETVIAIRDSVAPNISQVSSVKYVEDKTESVTNSNYVKTESYLKLFNATGISCDMATGKYYEYDEVNRIYTEVACNQLVDTKQYYLKVESYQPVEDGLTKDSMVTYYVAEKSDLGNNYLTSNNLIVKFDEPIYKIECSYYVYDSVTGTDYEKSCSIHNAEFDYREERTEFEFVFEPEAGLTDYFVNYRLTVYDFSNNSKTIASLFIDREKPVIRLNDNVDNIDKLETLYVGDDNQSVYNGEYVSTGFKTETTSIDSINNRINNVGATNISNIFTYSVRYYAFNYNITYKNYILVGNTPIQVADGEVKSTEETYYVKIVVPANYVLKGNEKNVCTNEAGVDYCYIKDENNYYPSLLTNELYWTEVSEKAYYIKNDSVAVYKIEYILTDYSGNVSDTLIKTVYCHDTTTPIITLNGEATLDKYGYHREVTIGFEGEKEANFYSYKCMDGVTTCELPKQIFDIGTGLEKVHYSSYDQYHETFYDEESIYKIYFHDKGNYVETKNGAGDVMMTLKYNYIEYTFLIDRTSPELYLNAYKDDDGNLYYKGHLDKEEYLYCVSADRNGEDPAFGSQLVECKNSIAFSGQWKNTNDYVNMNTVYDYKDGEDLYRLIVNGGIHILYKNNSLYELSYVNDTEYSYTNGIDTYTVKITGETYSLRINGGSFADFTKGYIFKDTATNIEYKLVIDGTDYMLIIDGVENVMVENNGIYEYKDAVKFMSYAVRYRNNKYQIKVTNEKLIIRQLFNTNGQLIYEERYEKLAVNAQKYFYNTYYYMSGDTLMPYAIGATYDSNNVYIIKSIDLYFRADGKYLFKAQDKSGNVSGRRVSSINYDKESTAFVIDNTAPDYNKSQNAPTGINYWFSVPRTVINEQNKQYIDNIRKTVSTDNYYNIADSGLNNDFYYAFATRSEAEKYLIEIYREHINSLEDKTCTQSGKQGFRYSYYDPSMKSIETKCFVGDNGLTDKNAAQNEISKIIKKMIFPTFSGSTLFGDNSIMQTACDSTVSSKCKENKDMYKMIYLKVDNTDPYNVTKVIAEECTEAANISCIKVNAKIIQNNASLGNSLSFEIGTEKTIDTTLVNVYSKSTDAASSTSKAEYRASATITLNNNSYYVFEEVDTTLSFSNYMKGVASQPTVTHYNTNYYAVYIDTNDYIDVYYEDGTFDYNGNKYSSSLTTTGVGTVKTNVDEYHLIIINNGDGNFANKYEIHELKVDGEIVEVYSYMMLKINNMFYNINDYLIRNGNKYYFKIPMQKEAVTNVEFIDRAGNVTFVSVSISQKAPLIDVVYNGEGGNQTATLIIEDTSFTKTDISSIEIKFSNNGKDYSDQRTGNIRASLVCVPGTTGYLYGCSNVGGANGVNNYRVIISNLEDLYGFFKVSLKDNHGNSNEMYFLYNPADMTAKYTPYKKYINASMDSENIRMITNEEVKLEFNNLINYVILYKYVDGEFIAVCNTMNISDGKCPGSNSLNKVSREVDDQGQYLKTVLHYVDEGIYQARIVNRASEIINLACFVDGGDGTFVVSEDCKKVKSVTSSICSWDNNPDYCDDALEIINIAVEEVKDAATYTRIEVDKSLPVINPNNFVVNLTTGVEAFSNNSTYTNAELLVKWEEDFVQLVYSCRYVDSSDPCNGNSTGFMVESKEYLFRISNRLSTVYEFWFEDYAGNSTINNKYSFTVNIVLPEIAVYAVEENGTIIESEQLTDGITINKNTKLLCYVDGENNERCDVYDVKLERFNGMGYVPVILPDLTRVSEPYGSQTSYKYTISIKNASTGEVYTNLRTEFTFTIDKQAPIITVEGNKDDLWGIYKGEVRVMISDDGVGMIFANCVVTGVDEMGDQTYTCDEDPKELFTSNTTINETGLYMVTAVDKVGNVTQGREIKFINVDNEAPTVKVLSKGEYLNYEISEAGFTNAETVIIEVSDNNLESKFKYRIKTSADVYGEWITHVSNSLEVVEEGYYEVVPIDAVGNEGIERHFIIYRQAPKFTVMVDDKASNNENDIIDKDFMITWDEPRDSYKAPIIKVTMNGAPYKKNDKIKDTGEYVFVFTDLAGNISNYKIAINKNKSICLNNVGITPKKHYLISLESPVIFNKDYKFTEDDVVVLATTSNYFGGSSACGENALNYRTISGDSYFQVGAYAEYANTNKKLPINLGEEDKRLIKDLGGYVYAIIIDIDVAKDDLGFPIGENFFTKDPLGWSLIFLSSAAVLYVGIRLIFFKKKVKVL